MKAAIIGCGIAGATAALALKKAGIESVIFERYPANADTTGAFLTLGANGLNALATIGADAPVRELGFVTPRLIFTNSRGAHLGTMPTGSSEEFASFTVKRADLYRSLRLQAVESGIEIRYGMHLTRFENDADRVALFFGNGASEEADVLIGCDGIQSQCRKLIDPQAPDARAIPLTNVSGYARNVPLDLQPGTFYMVFGKRAFFAYILAPSGEVWWFANIPAKTRANGAGDLLRLFADDAAPIYTIIEHTYEFTGEWPTFDIPKVPHWYRDRAIVIGDAAHAAAPSSGQGASLAIEDAIVLAKCLRDLPVNRAFSEYERLRRDRVERVVAFAARSSAAKIPGPIGSYVRDVFLRAMLARASKDNRNRWLHEYQVEWLGGRAGARGTT